jgi:hypothetical protein
LGSSDPGLAAIGYASFSDIVVTNHVGYRHQTICTVEHAYCIGPYDADVSMISYVNKLLLEIGAISVSFREVL